MQKTMPKQFANYQKYHKHLNKPYFPKEKPHIYKIEQTQKNEKKHEKRSQNGIENHQKFIKKSM